MKGITPVIATILLLLITIAMVGFAYVWLNGVAQKTLNSTQTVLQSDIDEAEKNIRLDNIIGAARTVTVRNVGRQTVGSSVIALYIGNIAATGGLWVPSSIAPGDTATRTWTSPPCPAGTEIKVTGPGNSDQAVC